MPPVFFLSYAHKDAEEKLFRKFMRALCKEVVAAGALSAAAVPFIDRKIKPGVPWNPRIGQAVGSCAVFVPIFSPYYFQSEMCGKEWSAFTQRQPAGGSQDPAAGRNVLPVTWRTLRADPPAFVSRLQDSRDQFGDEYRTQGLQPLIALTKNRDDYRDFLRKFAELILEAANEPPETIEVPDLEALPNAFATTFAASPLPAEAPNRPATRARAGGPSQVTFIVAAEPQHTMQEHRSRVDTYADNRNGWRPYHPACSNPVAIRAQGVASRLNLFSSVTPADVPLSDTLFDTLKTAKNDRKLVVLLVDPWTVKVPGYADLYDRLNEIRSGNAAIVIPQEAPDQPAANQIADDPAHGRATAPDTDDSAVDVHGQLAERLDLWLREGEQVLLRDIASIEEFETALGKLLVNIRAWVVNRAEVAWRESAGEGPRSRPVLSGPGS